MTASRLPAVLVVGLSLLYAGCGGTNLTLPGEGDPAHISVVSGTDNQNARVGSQLNPLVVQVTDSKSRPVGGATVDFSFDDAAAGGAMIPTSAITKADGTASTVITLGDQVGPYNGHARVPVAQGTVPVEVAFTATAVPDNANGLAPVSGNEQHGQVGSQLGQPLVVQVTDRFSNPIAGVTVNWTVTGGGSVSAAATVTGADGTTSVTRTLGTTAGTQTTVATSEGLAGSPVTFTSEATAGSAARVDKLAGDNQSALAGTELPNALVVQVLDAQGNSVVGRAVTWVIGAGGGSVTPSNTNTDAQGKASTRWTLGSSVTTNTVNAVVSGVGTATFTAEATAGSVSASRSTASASPRTITAGASTSTITVRVRDANGTAVSGVAVSATSSGTGGDAFDPTSATSDGNGVATIAFGSTVAETKTITVTAGSVTLNQKPTITVVKAQSRTRIIGQTPNPSTPGQSVHVTFSVTSGEGGGTPTGQVTIVSEQQPGVSCTADVSVGACDITLSASGDHHLIATYPGDQRFGDSSDDDHHQVVNQAPVANADNYSTQAATPLSVPAPGVLGNDTDANGDPLTANVVSSTTQGGLVLNPDGSFTYSPNPGATGTDSFVYTATDPTLTSAPATVTITLTP